MNKKKTNEELQKIISKKHKNIIILYDYTTGDKTKVKRYFRCKCDIDNHEWDVVYSSLILQGTGCPACCNQCVTEQNNFYNNCPHLVKYFKNIEDTKSITAKSTQTKRMCCIDCGFEKDMKVFDLCKHGFSCNRCGDGFSIPNKFMLNVLKQIDINVKTEYGPKWANGKRYDFYIESLNVIIEMHGKQHYEESPRGRDLQTEQENDKLKYDMAIKSGIQHKNYIVIDCRHSEFEWLKKNVQVMLCNIISLDEINWACVYSDCMKSNVVKSWELFKQGLSVGEISKNIGIDPSTVSDYLKRGSKINKIEYNPKEEMFKRYEKMRIKVSMFFNGEILETFNSLTEAKSKTGFSARRLLCKNKRQYFDGYTFKVHKKEV